LDVLSETTRGVFGEHDDNDDDPQNRGCRVKLIAVQKIKVKKPAKGPKPNMATKKIATMIKRATGRTKPTLGEVLWAAKKAMGIAMTKPNKVPKVAIFRVSHMGHHNSCTEAQAGGIIREPIS